MLQTISGKFQAWTKGWLVLVLLALDMFFMTIVMPLTGALMKSGTGLEKPLDLMFLATPDKMFAMIEIYGEYGRPFYRTVELTVDIIYPIIYLLAFGLTISWLFQRGFARDSKMQMLNTMPVGMWLFDLLENLGIVTMLTMWPSQPVVVAWLTMVFTAVKWMFAGGSMLLMVVGLTMAARNGFRRRE
ncbi:MAG: hypothetical protein HY867_20685 [Chloroflexi bacterium]|nr:hypothetical protein [Chloroflexota bacterium]